MNNYHSCLSGKRALITGAGTGIGQEIALEYARQGADVVLHCFHNKKGAIDTENKIKELGRRVKIIKEDLSEIDSCFDLVRKTIDFFNGLDILVNNAGLSYKQEFIKTLPKDFDQVFNINIRAPYFCAQQAVDYWIKNHLSGVVVNLASIDGLRGLDGHSAYAASKGAVIAWTRQLGVELAPKKIRINAIAPGMIEVERTYRYIPNFNAELAGEIVPYKRIGRVSDIAKAAVYLGSDNSEYIIGQTMVVDGGTSSKMAFDLDRVSFS